MTTSRSAGPAPRPEISPAEIPAPTRVPDQETLARVLDGLRDLPDRPAGRPAPGSGSGDVVDATAAVPLPRRRAARRAPSVD